jgi:hypothetical protein
MTRPPRSPARIAAHEKVAADLFLEGKRYSDIAVILDLAPSTVADHIQALTAEWHAEAVMDIEIAKGIELAKINKLEQTYWAAWERSLEDKQVITVKSRPIRPDENPVTPGTERQRAVRNQELIFERMIRTERAEGNPAWLLGIQWCIKMRCEIFGLEAPKKIAPTLPNGQPLPMSTRFDLSACTLEELEILESIWLRQKLAQPPPLPDEGA